MKDIPINKKNRQMLRRTVLVSLFIALLLCIPNITIMVKAADIIVDDDGTGDYTTIQDAIDAASTGDTIWVKDGSYNEQLNVHTSVKIIADNGAEPIIYATSYTPGIDVTANNITIEGFKIYGNSNPGGGPTIRASSGADELVVKSNTFTEISGEIGNVALQILSTVHEVKFTSNTVMNYDTGVLLQDDSMVGISGNSFQNVNYSVYHAARISGTNIYYGSIQDAVDNADTGDAIYVKLGLYGENIVINRSMTLEGAKADVNPVGGRFGEESIIDGNILSAIRIVSGAADVTINGFTLTISNKDPSSNQAGVLIGSNTNNIVVKNNIIENITDGSGGPGSDTLGDETYGVMVYGHAGSDNQTNISILKNLIQNVEEYGIAINDNTSHVTISGNHITELIGSDHTGEGIPWDPSWPAIICAAIHLGGQVGPISDVNIGNNILKTNAIGDGTSSAAGGGISFAGIQEPLPPNRNWQGFEQVSITDNKIFNNTMGIIALAGMSNGSIDVHDNNISDNSLFGINNTVSNASFDATENWWGNITGPYNATDNFDGTGDNVTGNVTFWPWYEFDGYSIPPFVDYDVEDPQVNFGEIIRETTKIEINANDNESGMYSLTYRIWNTTHRWGPWMNYTGSFTLPGQGNHRVQHNATDNAGTSTYISDLVYEEHRVDDVSPVVQVLYPNGGEFEYGTIPIEWTASDRIFDQGQLQTNASIPLTEDYPGHIQSFIPTEDSIDSVQLLVSGDDANVSVKLFSEIYPIPTAMGQSVKRIQNIGTPTWIDFPFSSSINLDTAKTYYIGVTQDIYGDAGMVWYYFNDSNITVDKYPYGHAWVKETDALVNESSMDFAFKTMYWKTDIDITVQYSMTGVSPWSTIAENEGNDGSYNWDTTSLPDGQDYKVRVVTEDEIVNMQYDISDDRFTIDNDGPSIYNIIITDTTIGNTEFTKNGDNLEITAIITGDPEEGSIKADLSGFGKGSAEEPDSFTGGTARWIVTDIVCMPPDGSVVLTINVTDATGDTAFNTGSIIADNSAPDLTITRPGPGLYIMDGMRLLPFSYPFIIGQITITADVTDEGSGVKEVEFYLEGDIESNASEVPYSWLWDRAATGFFDLEVKAYDIVGHTAIDEIKDLFIINFDIIGHQ